MLLYNIIGGDKMSNDDLKYMELWIKNISNWSNEKLQRALEKFFGVTASKDYNKEKLVAEIERQKLKREKKFKLVLELNLDSDPFTRERQNFPLNIFNCEKNGELYEGAFLAEIDAFTVKFDDEKELISIILDEPSKFFAPEQAVYLERIKNEISPSWLSLKIFENGEILRNDPPYYYRQPVYSDNLLLTNFLEKKGNKLQPFYNDYDADFNFESGIREFNLNKSEQFQEYIFDSLTRYSDTWPSNKTFESNSLRNYCENEPLNGIYPFRFYEDIRIASIILYKYVNEKEKERNL